MTSIKIILCFIFLFFFFLLILLPVVHSSHSHPLSSDHQTLSNSLKLSPLCLTTADASQNSMSPATEAQRHRPTSWPTPSNSQVDPSPKPLIHASDPRRGSMPATHTNPTRLSNALTHQLCLSSLKSDSPSPKLFLLTHFVELPSRPKPQATDPRLRPTPLIHACDPRQPNAPL